MAALGMVGGASEQEFLDALAEKEGNSIVGRAAEAAAKKIEDRLAKR